jgi:predicted HAD superfamily phosphohydrolase YqeG
MVNQGIKIVIFSNMKMSDRYDPLIAKVKEATGFEMKIITSPYAKPDAQGFIDCVKELGLKAGEDELMIGDNFITDGGSIQVGIPFIKVDPIMTNGEGIKGVKRWPQRGLRFLHSGVSRAYDVIGRRKVLKDKDFTE